MRGFVVAGLCLILTGCSSVVKFEQTKEVDPGEAWTGIVEAASKDSKIKVDLTATEPVNFYLVTKDLATEANEGKMDRGEEIPGSLGHKLKTKSESFEITAPGGKEVQYFVFTTGKKATVTLKLNTP